MYHFVSQDNYEVLLDRNTRKIENTDDRFAFQKGKDSVYMSMRELISLPDFLYHIHAITEPYFVDHPEIKKTHEHHSVIDEHEQINIKRLIDRALDERDETTFYQRVKML